MIYFCPVTCSWEPIRRGLFESSIDISFGTDSYVWYADQATGEVYGSESSDFCVHDSTYGLDTINNAKAWKYFKEGVDQGNYCKKIRLISAYLKIINTGRLDDR